MINVIDDRGYYDVKLLNLVTCTLTVRVIEVLHHEFFIW